MTPKLTPAGEALVAVEYCLATIPSVYIAPEDNAIWSTGSSDRPRITQEYLETARQALEILDRIQRGDTKELRREYEGQALSRDYIRHWDVLPPHPATENLGEGEIK